MLQHLRMTNKIITKLLCFFSRLGGDIHQVRTESTVERLMVLDLLLVSSKENSQVLPPRPEIRSGDLLPETL